MVALPKGYAMPGHLGHQTVTQVEGWPSPAAIRLRCVEAAATAIAGRAFSLPSTLLNVAAALEDYVVNGRPEPETEAKAEPTPKTQEAGDAG